MLKDSSKELGWYSFGLNVIFASITVFFYYDDFGKIQLVGLLLMSIAIYQFLDYAIPLICERISNVFIVLLITLILISVLTQLSLYILK